jgi:multidrug efflux pump subunit AcrB
VDEVGNPTILATWAVIAAVLPMAFVGGLMGPYMRPIPIGSSAAMLFSLLDRVHRHAVGRIRILRGHAQTHASAGAAAFATMPRSPTKPNPPTNTIAENTFTRLYQRVMARCSTRPAWRWIFLAVIVAAATVGSMGLVGISAVKVKMLPFDNKSEFQVILNMPEGSTLEQHRPHRPRDRRRPPHRARGARLPDLRRHRVAVQFQRPRPPLLHAPRPQRRRHPGQPLPSTSAPRRATTSPSASARASPPSPRNTAPPSPSPRCRPARPCSRPSSPKSTAPTSVAPRAEKVREIYRATPGVVDIDWYVEDRSPRPSSVVDKAKAALHGITEAAIARTVQLAVQGYPVTLLHSPDDREDVNVVLELPRALRPRPEDLLSPSPCAPR